MKRISLSISALLLLIASAQAEVLILEGGYYIENVEVIANKAGKIIFKHDDRFHELNSKYILQVKKQAPAKNYTPLKPEEVTKYLEKIEMPSAGGPGENPESGEKKKIENDESMSTETQEELTDPAFTEMEDEATELVGLQRLSPGKPVKIYFYNGKTIKGMLNSWGAEEIILQGKDGEYVVEIADVVNVKYFISPQDIGETNIISYLTPLRPFTEEEKQEKEREEKLASIEKQINGHKSAQRIEHAFGLTAVVLGGGLFIASEGSRDDQSGDEFISDMQSIVGLAIAMAGAGLLAAAAGHTDPIIELQKQEYELTVRGEAKFQYNGLRLSVLF